MISILCLRLTTSVSYQDLQRVHDKISLISQGYPDSPGTSPYRGSNRHIFNTTVTTHSSPYDSPRLGHDARRFAPHNAHMDSGFTNYGFQPEGNENVLYPYPMNKPATNILYYPHTSTRTLQVPNTTLKRSVSDSRIPSLQSTQHGPQMYQYQPEVSHVAGFQPQNEAAQEQSNTKASWMNSTNFREIGHDISFPIPRASMLSGQRTYSTTSEVSLGHVNPVASSQGNSSEI